MIICVSPVRNEDWILDRFLAATSLWADKIIIADQKSTDGSREITARYPKALLIENAQQDYDEGERQRLLLAQARSFPGPKIILALDADEFLAADFGARASWSSVLQAKPGTVIEFPWVNIAPRFEYCWYGSQSRPFGFVDDGSEHIGSTIHSVRIPVRECAPRLQICDIPVLHYQYLSWERMQSKHRWYQCWERLKWPRQSAVEIFRKYHRMESIQISARREVRPEWLAAYEEAGIDMRSVLRYPYFSHDVEILKWFELHGAKTFSKEAIWDVDWRKLAKLQDRKGQVPEVGDPRSRFEKRVHSWLIATQGRSASIQIRLVERLLRFIGW